MQVTCSPSNPQNPREGPTLPKRPYPRTLFIKAHFEPLLRPGDFVKIKLLILQPHWDFSRVPFEISRPQQSQFVSGWFPEIIPILTSPSGIPAPCYIFAKRKFAKREKPKIWPFFAAAAPAVAKNGLRWPSCWPRPKIYLQIFDRKIAIFRPRNYSFCLARFLTPATKSRKPPRYRSRSYFYARKANFQIGLACVKIETVFTSSIFRSKTSFLVILTENFQENFENFPQKFSKIYDW